MSEYKDTVFLPKTTFYEAGLPKKRARNFKVFGKYRYLFGIKM